MSECSCYADRQLACPIHGPLSEPGLPLTTGEGNTAAEIVKRAFSRWHRRDHDDVNEIEQEILAALPLTTGEGNTAGDQRKIDAYDAARATVKVEGNTRAYYVLRAEAAEAECGRLREQLDAAQQALAEYEKAVQKALEIAPLHWQRYRDQFELGGEIRAARVAGRAALGVEGDAAVREQEA